MFDIGFSELMVIAVVALVVIGPERLPRVARTAGHLLGRLQRYVNDVKADINREMELEELRKFKNEFEQSAQAVESQINDEINKSTEMFNSIAADLTPHDETGRTDVLPETGPGLEPAKSTGQADVPLPVSAEQKSKT